MLEIDVRSYDKYKDVKVTIDSMVYELGFHNEEETKALIYELRDAIEMLVE